MKTGDSTTETAVLVRQARDGDARAYATLYEQFYPAVRRAAYRMVRDQHEAEDLAQEAFYMVFRAVRAGRGPDDSFIGYVLSTVRRLAFRHSSARSHVWVTDDVPACERPQPTADRDSKILDDAAAALASLPERWRQVLWLIEVDNYSPAELAPRLGMSATAVSSLATRARDALRTAFLIQQVADDDGACTRFTPRLAAYVRGTLAGRWIPPLARHVESCSVCQQRLGALAACAMRIGVGSTPAPANLVPAAPLGGRPADSVGGPRARRPRGARREHYADVSSSRAVPHR